MQDKISLWVDGVKITIALVLVFFVAPFSIILFPIAAVSLIMYFFNQEISFLQEYGEMVYLISLVTIGPYYIAKSARTLAAKDGFLALRN